MNTKLKFFTGPGRCAMKLLLACCLAPAAQAQYYYTNSYGVWSYTPDNGTITVTGVTNTPPNGVVVIPDTINSDPVTSIGDYAFYDQTALTGVTIGNSVTSIGESVFKFCSGLKSVTLGSGVANMGDEWFSACSGLTNIAVDAGNASYASAGGVLFNKAMSWLFECPQGLAGNYAVPNSVTIIEGDAFLGCSDLTSVTIPASVTYIGSGAFWNCSGLTNVTIPSGVTSIGESTFLACSRLMSVTIPDSVTSIGEYAFENCGLTSVTIPGSVTSIEDFSFAGCSDLASATIPDSLTSIGFEAFVKCDALTNIAVNAGNASYASAGGVLFDKAMATLIEYPGGLAGSYAVPNNVTSIGEYAFDGCSGLTSVTIPGSVTSIGPDAFLACYALTNVTIGDSVTSIEDYAFSACTNLTSVTIPDSVTSLDQDAFYGCSGLHQAYFQGNAPSANGQAGSEDNTVFQDAGAGTVYYLPGATGWGATFGGWPTAVWLPQVQASNGSLGVKSNQFGFNINWAGNMVVVVEAATNLANPVWVPVSTNTLTGGTSAFSDPQWTNYPGRYYRVTTP